MRRLILSGLIAALALPAIGGRRVSVVQLDEALAASDATHRPDLDAARQIGELEMTERLTGPTLNHFAATHKLGPRTALALQLLADQSVFLDPPRNELPATAFPDAATQKRILDAAQAYSVETWTRLPNFFVTRVTHRFDDSPHVLTKGDWPVRAGLQPIGTSSRQVSFREGKEVQDLSSEAGATGTKPEQELGLHSWGEFGPELTVVLADMARHKVEFSHWEQIGTRLASVFRYEVPREASHYAVNYCCTINQQVLGRTQFGYSGRDRSPQQVANIPRKNESHTYSETPGYHGTLAIDPADGAVLRITIQAELSIGDPLLRAETMVEYGPVTIGDRQFICPLRSLAISMEQASMGGSGNSKTVSANGVGDDSSWQTTSKGGSAPILLVNETSFVEYHRLGSTARILTDTAATGAPSAQPSDASLVGPAMSAANLAAIPGAANAEAAVPTANGGVEQPPTETAASPTPSAPSISPPATPAEPVIPEVSLSAATGVPDKPADATQSAEEGYSLKVTSRLVDVGLVAYDKKGHPVTDLNPGELEIYDNGHKQEIRSFGLAANAQQPVAPAVSSGTAVPVSPETEEPSFANRAPDTTGSVSANPSSEIGSTILVIDESHIAWSDMSFVRAQILKFLGSLGPGERVGLYSMTGLGFHVLAEVTTDHATLIARMQKFMPSSQSVAEAQDEETRNRQHFDEVHNASDLNSVNGNHTEVPDAEQPVDPQLLTMGDNPARASFIILSQVARHLSSIPGHKKLVWVSSDNVLADWQDQAVAIDKSPKDVAAYLMQAQEAMNEAHAAVYPFDVSQLESGGVSADLQHQNVQLTPAAGEAASLGGGQTASRSSGPGRIDAAMSQDLHPVQGPVRQVAAATGGRVIRRSGDLSAQLNGIVSDGHSTYMLSFSPQGPADGQYHTINIKLTGRRGLSLSYRTGYLFEKEPSTLRERFQQAVWRPADVSEIAVSASVSRESAGANVKINIAAGDLGLRQQAGRWIDKLDIFFIRRDDAGLHARVEGQTLGLRLKSATFEKLMPIGVPFEQFVEKKPSMASLRVLVVDENSGRMGSVTIPASAIGAGQ
jgi:VWFA-related protein